MKITNITGRTGNQYPNSEGDKKAISPVLGFIAGLAMTACPTLLPQPAEFNSAPVAPVMPDSPTTLV